MKTKTRFKAGVLEISVENRNSPNSIRVGDLARFADLPDVFKVIDLKYGCEYCGWAVYVAKPVEFVKHGDKEEIKSFEEYRGISWHYLSSRKKIA